MFRKSRGDNEVVITALHQKSYLKLQKQDKMELSQIKKGHILTIKFFLSSILDLDSGSVAQIKKMMTGL